MIDVDLLSVIRCWHAREHLSIREIAKRTFQPSLDFLVQR